MYNKAVVTILALALMAGAGHAQYYSTHYATPGSFGYANTQYAGQGGAAGFNYFGFMPGPVFYPSRPLADYGFAYASPGLVPTYGRGFGIGSIALSAPTYASPTYGPGFGLGSVNLALKPHHIPSYGKPLSFGSVHYNMASNMYVMPIYATPSRALFNSEFAFGTVNRFY